MSESAHGTASDPEDVKPMVSSASSSAPVPAASSSMGLAPVPRPRAADIDDSDSDEDSDEDEGEEGMQHDIVGTGEEDVLMSPTADEVSRSWNDGGYDEPL